MLFNVKEQSVVVHVAPVFLQNLQVTVVGWWFPRCSADAWWAECNGTQQMSRKGLLLWWPGQSE